MNTNQCESTTMAKVTIYKTLRDKALKLKQQSIRRQNLAVTSDALKCRSIDVLHAHTHSQTIVGTEHGTDKIGDCNIKRIGDMLTHNS